jgi:hypothetical protein
MRGHFLLSRACGIVIQTNSRHFVGMCILLLLALAILMAEMEMVFSIRVAYQVVLEVGSVWHVWQRKVVTMVLVLVLRTLSGY